MAIGIETVFLILGGLIFIGYFGEHLSRRLTIPVAFLLLLIGFGLRFSGIVDAQDFLGIQGIFGTLALIVLLFDGGLSLNLYDAVFKSGRSLFAGFFTTVLATIITAGFFLMIGLDPIIGAIIGAIVGGIDTGITLSLMHSMTFPEKVKNFLTIESSSNDVISIILAIVLTQALILGAINPAFIAQEIVGKFAIGIFIGILVGVASILTLAKIEQGYNYMITLAIVLLLYSTTEFLNGSGAIAVLVFGIVLGNETSIRRAIHSKEVESYPMIKEFQSEVSFFIRTFFFVFLGIVVTIGNTNSLIISAILMIILYLIRYIVIHIATVNSEMEIHKKMLVAINPRGLATAVLATYPLIVVQNEIAANPDFPAAEIIAKLGILPEVAFYLIILSVIFTTILLPISKGMEKNNKEEE